MTTRSEAHRAVRGWAVAIIVIMICLGSLVLARRVRAASPPQTSTSVTGVDGQPDDSSTHTLTRFWNENGFRSDGGSDLRIAYTVPRLGVGRDLHCVQSKPDEETSEVACYVTNYVTAPHPQEDDLDESDLGDSSVTWAQAAWDNNGPNDKYRSLATKTFCIEFKTKPGSSDANPDITFSVYQGGDGTGTLEDKLQLAERSVPDACLLCHSGPSQSATPNGPAFIALPADAKALVFAPGISAQDQQPIIDQLNRLFSNPILPADVSWHAGGQNPPWPIDNQDSNPSGLKASCRRCHGSGQSHS